MAGAAFVTDITEITTQAAEAAAGLGSILQSYDLIKIARNYYDLYKRQRDFYYNTFQTGVEGSLAAEIFADPKPIIDYAGQVAAAYNTDTGPFGGKATDIQGWWTRHAQAYGTAIDPNLTLELLTDSLRIKTDWTNYLFRFEETQFDLKSDIRWKKRLAVHNVGLKIGSNISSALDTSLSEYQGHIADTASQLATYGNGIARWVGYKRGLADTSEAYDAMQYGVRNIEPQIQFNPGERPYVSDAYKGGRLA